jgi:Lanthionine synthetase C-like protein
MKNKQEKINELYKISQGYLIELEDLLINTGTNEQDIVQISGEILQLISLQSYHIGARVKLINLCVKLKEVGEKLPHTYCLFTGRMRIIYTFLKVYESLQEDTYLDYAKLLFVENKFRDYAITAQNNTGILKGRLGAFLGLLYLKKNIPTLEIDDTLDFTFNEIIKNLVVDKYGLLNFFQDSHKDSLTGLANGNAGLIWFFSTIIRGNSADDEIKEIIQYLLQSLDGQWNIRRSNWKDNSMQITSVNEHLLYIEQFEKGNFSFFKSPKNNYNFWEGSLGICVSLTNYLLYSNQKENEILNKIERNLKNIEKKKGIDLTNQNVKALCYIYSSLHRITGDSNYAQKIEDLIETPILEKTTKVSLLLSVLENHDVEKLDILPNLKNLNYLHKGLLDNVKKALIVRYYPQTLNLLNFLHKDYFESKLLQSNCQLTLKFFQDFDYDLKNEFLSLDKKYVKIIKDSFVREQLNRKSVAKHSNKIFLKIQDIVQFSQADTILNLEDSALLSREFIIADDVYVKVSKWNWSQVGSMPLDKIIEIEASSHFELIKVKPINDQKITLPFSENQLILFELFYEKISINQAKISFFNNFDIASETEYLDLTLFFDKTIESFIFNRLIVSNTEVYKLI